MKYHVSDHNKVPSSEIIEALEADEWGYSRSDLMEKAVMWYLYVERDMNNVEIFEYLSERADEPFNKNDVTMSLRWWGLIPSSGTPLQARASSITEVLSFGWQL